MMLPIRDRTPFRGISLQDLLRSTPYCNPECSIEEDTDKRRRKDFSFCRHIGLPRFPGSLSRLKTREAVRMTSAFKLYSSYIPHSGEDVWSHCSIQSTSCKLPRIAFTTTAQRIPVLYSVRAHQLFGPLYILLHFCMAPAKIYYALLIIYNNNTCYTTKLKRGQSTKGERDLACG